MNILRALALLFSAVSVAAAQSVPHETLLAISKRDHTLAVVDPATLKVIGRASSETIRMKSSPRPMARPLISPTTAGADCTL